MSKAILILDEMPNNCEECSLCTNGIDCAILGWVVSSSSGQENRDNNCPLITEEEYIKSIYPILYDLVARGVLSQREIAKKVGVVKVGKEE